MTKPKIIETNISNLTPDPNNARKRTPLSAKVISKSLEQFGACRSIVIDENDVIRAGNGTFEEAGQLGIEKVLVVEADGNTIVAVKRKGLSESDWKQYAIADNTASDFSTWDFDILNDLTQEVDLSEFFPDYKLNELLESFGKGEGFGSTEQVEEDEEAVNDLLDKVDEIESRVKPGEIWQLGRHKIACGDSTIDGNVRALLGDRFGDVGMVWSDAPYGFGLMKEGSIGKIGNSREYVAIANDQDTKCAHSAFNTCRIFDCVQVWWGANYFTDVNLPSSKCWIVWDKDHHGMTFADAELAWTNIDKPTRCFRHAWSGNHRDSEQGVDRVHPNQKPVALCEWCFEKYGQANDVIFDPFLGSAPSIIAAEKMEGDRTVYGFELSPAYCEIILQRFEKLTGIEPKLIGRLPD
jgi:site-specific DNA-methyltransferase (adenine-specific)